MTERRPRRTYTTEDIERGLFALALYGDATAASRQLEASGQRVPKSTLQSWKLTHAERFQEIANEHARKVREVIAQEQVEIAHAAGQAERVAIAKTKKQLEDGEVKDASTAGRNLGVQKGIALDHALKQRGEPTVVHEHRQADEVFERLRKLAPQVFVIEGQADEMPALPNGNGAGAE